MPETWLSLHLSPDPRRMLTICQHARLITIWPDGLKVPEPKILAEMAVLGHAIRHGCPCATMLWADLATGELCLLDTLRDRTLPPEERAALEASGQHPHPGCPG